MSRRARQQIVFFIFLFRRNSQNIRLASPFLTRGIWNFSFPTSSSLTPFFYFIHFISLLGPNWTKLGLNWAKSAIKPSLKRCFRRYCRGGDLKLTLSYTLLGCKAMATKLWGNLLFFFHWSCNNNGATLTISWEHHYMNFIPTSIFSVVFSQ